jgi:subtilisin family serine protease
MKPIARFSAPRAALPSVARICSHLALPLCLISFSTSSLGLSVRHDCGDAEAAPGRFIVRAVSTKQALSAQGEAVQASSTRDMSVIDSLILEKPSRLIHKSRASATLTVAGEKVAAENSVDNSVVTVASRLSTEQLSALQTDPSVLSIEQDCIVHVDSLPNDPVPAQYTFVRDSLNLEKAWSRKTDSSNIVVAISDTGVDVNHADLHDNIWTNVSELSGRPGIDDDGNGCIDDVHGCDFGDYDGDPSPFTSGEGDHGTHVAGIIGAIGNNSAGAVGVSWQATLMAVKGFDSAGNALVSDLLNTLYYSVNNGARVINCSWGANRVPTQAEKDAFQFAISNGVLPVVAAGNSGIDAAKTSPAGIDGVLTVGSVNSLDQVSGFSNYGSHVAVYAPGGDAMAAGGTRDEFIYSTLPTAHGAYGTMRGTSMAAPFVTGIAALVF